MQAVILGCLVLVFATTKANNDHQELTNDLSGVDFSSSGWINGMKPGVLIELTSSTGDIYKLSGDGNEVVINGFVLKTADWDKVTAGQTAEIFGNGQSAFLENAGNSSFWENIKFNGKQMFGEDFGLTVSQLCEEDMVGHTTATTATTSSTSEATTTPDYYYYDTDDGDVTKSGSEVTTKSTTKGLDDYYYTDGDDNIESEPVLNVVDVTTTPTTAKQSDQQSAESCEISKQCKNLSICTKDSICKRIACKNTEDCTNESFLPTKCETLFPGASYCTQQNCETDADCGTNNEGLEHGCFSDEQCKPNFGECESTCDCVENFKMKKGEAKCYRNKCYCRSEILSKCFEAGPPPKTTKRNGNDKNEPGIAVPEGECPIEKTHSQVKKGEKCSAHSKCIQWGGLVCAKPSASENGLCKDIKCSSDAECLAESILPLKCMGGWCKRSACASNKDCPEGYGCFKDNQCKKILGDCQFDCDCSGCPGIQCFKEKCFCMNDADDCRDIPKLLGSEDSEAILCTDRR